MTDDNKIYDLIKPTAEAMKYVLEYFALKNKVLWTGSAGAGGVITVPDLSKYQLAQIYVSYGYIIFNPQIPRLKGAFPDANGTGYNCDYINFAGTISGDTITISRCNYYLHTASGNHGAGHQIQATNVIGLLPILPESLQTLINAL